MLICNVGPATRRLLLLLLLLLLLTIAMLAAASAVIAVVVNAAAAAAVADKLYPHHLLAICSSAKLDPCFPVWHGRI